MGRGKRQKLCGLKYVLLPFYFLAGFYLLFVVGSDLLSHLSVAKFNTSLCVSASFIPSSSKQLPPCSRKTATRSSRLHYFSSLKIPEGKKMPPLLNWTRKRAWVSESRPRAHIWPITWPGKEELLRLAKAESHDHPWHWCQPHPNYMDCEYKVPQRKEVWAKTV